ncbi:hypothetical protein I79_003865 [Cricetulus griseus]|uniref:Uncharacterized protein n=1 Tax=Cricetulus griseus TaxID=10029 RepID=G3H141_CRIGR|nr:hypothetical protein I79_003865 [Cricetulus griseus]
MANPSQNRVSSMVSNSNPKRGSPPLFGHVLRKPWPMYSLISGMTEAKKPELSNPINTKGWQALCKRVSF